MILLILMTRDLDGDEAPCLLKGIENQCVC